MDWSYKIGLKVINSTQIEWIDASPGNQLDIMLPFKDKILSLPMNRRRGLEKGADCRIGT
jgi:hypothetical protein